MGAVESTVFNSDNVTWRNVEGYFHGILVLFFYIVISSHVRG